LLAWFETSGEIMMHIAVFGSGGVGGYFGGRLALAGEDVTFIARGEHLRALGMTGLKVDSVGGDFLIHPAKATSEPAEVGPVDLVILGVKAWQVPEAALDVDHFERRTHLQIDLRIFDRAVTVEGCDDGQSIRTFLFGPHFPASGAG
jgi:hypothetical protein